MTWKQIFVAYTTMVRKEAIRLFRIWGQTLLPSVITMALYFVIFGKFIGSQVESIQGVSYVQFIVPGLIMMAVITNAFMNVVSTFYSAKFMRSIEEILVSPMPNWTVIAGAMTGGVLRGLLVGILVLFTALLFTHLPIHSYTITIVFIVLTAALFSLAGLTNGIFAKSFDHISIVPTFVLTPLTYLGGVFYSIELLPPVWQIISQANPILYLVNGFRYGFLGISDVSVGVSLTVLIVFCLLLLALNLFLFQRGYGLRS